MAQTARDIFYELAYIYKDESPIYTEEVHDNFGKYTAKKIILIDHPEALGSEALGHISEANKYIPGTIQNVKMRICTVVLGRKQIRINMFSEVKLMYEKAQAKNPFINFPNMTEREIGHFAQKRFFSMHLGDDGEAWIHNTKRKEISSWPATLVDIYNLMFDPRTRELVRNIVAVWSKSSGAWKDIIEDLNTGTAYAAIPVKTIFDSEDRRGIMKAHYKADDEKANTRTIGESIFLKKSEMLVNYHV